MNAWPAVCAEIVFGHNSSVKREQLEIGCNNTRISWGNEEIDERKVRNITETDTASYDGCLEISQDKFQHEYQ